MYKLLLTTTAITLSSTSLALALDLKGNVGFIYTDIESSSGPISTSFGSVEVGTNGPLSIQLDLGSVLTDGDPEYGHGYIHGIYDLGGTTSIGLFTGHEDWDGDRWVTTGLEFRTAFGEGSTGGVAIEGFVAQTEFDGDIDDMFGAKVIWSATPMIDVYGSYATSSGVDDLQNVGIGAVYSHSSGAYGRIGIDNLSGDSDRDSFTVEIGFKVNDGATFATRSWNDIFPGY